MDFRISLLYFQVETTNHNFIIGEKAKECPQDIIKYEMTKDGKKKK